MDKAYEYKTELTTIEAAENEDKKKEWKDQIREEVRDRITSTRNKIRKKTPSGILEEIRGIDEPYQMLKEQKERMIEHDVSTIQAHFSFGQRNKKLDRLAKERLSALLNPATPFEHDQNFLQRHHLAENLHRGYFTSASDIMTAFIKSSAHRENIKGTYNSFGVAIKDNTVVILYQDGESRKGTDEKAVLKELREYIATHPESSKTIDILGTIKKNLEQEAKTKDMLLTIHKNPPGIVLQKNGQLIIYLFKENSLTFVRKDGLTQKKEIPLDGIISDAYGIFSPAQEEAAIGSQKQ